MNEASGLSAWWGHSHGAKPVPKAIIDVLYEIVGTPSLFDLGGLLMDLQDDLGRPVDLVDRGMVKPRIRVAMERDLAPL